VAAMAMVRDLFGPKDSAKVLSLLLLVLGASPMIAPTAGGYIVTTAGLAGDLPCLLILGVVILALSIFFLPDSYPADRGFSLKPGRSSAILSRCCRCRNSSSMCLYRPSLCWAFCLRVGVAGSIHGHFHLDKRAYGWVFAGLSVAFIGLSHSIACCCGGILRSR